MKTVYHVKQIGHATWYWQVNDGSGDVIAFGLAGSSVNARGEAVIAAIESWNARSWRDPRSRYGRC